MTGFGAQRKLSRAVASFRSCPKAAARFAVGWNRILTQ
jgi:hypothetical protein